MEDSHDAVDEVGQNVRRLESSLLVEIGDCRRSGDGLEKRLSKLEGVCGRLDGVSDSINKLNQGNSWQWVELPPSRTEVRLQQADCCGRSAKVDLYVHQIHSALHTAPLWARLPMPYSMCKSNASCCV